MTWRTPPEAQKQPLPVSGCDVRAMAIWPLDAARALPRSQIPECIDGQRAGRDRFGHETTASRSGRGWGFELGDKVERRANR
jgi:hypothetical protein